ncbi:hypothetical protein PWT90_00272 [Aphanocladium album]|nr:hypothetical protein PWT90_00272 [Aphanocladium album]
MPSPSPRISGNTRQTTAAKKKNADTDADTARHARADEAEEVVGESENWMHHMPVSFDRRVHLLKSGKKADTGGSSAPTISTRRVKCDEKKPVCGNCSIKSRPCDISGETIIRGRQTKSTSPLTKTKSPAPELLSETQPPTPTPTPSPLASAPRRRVAVRRAGHHFVHDVTPWGWDWVEACEYWNSVYPIDTEQDLLLPCAFPTKPDKTKFIPGPIFAVFIMGSLAHNMSRICRLLGVKVATEPLPELSRMRQKYNHYMGNELVRLNKDIANPETYGTTRVFGRLIGLIASEVDIHSPNLRLHLQGFITLITVSGGVQRVLERKEANILAIIFVMVADLLRAASHAVFENIAAFQPEKWLERYEMPKDSIRTPLARIYQLAVAFYAKRTLAARAGIDHGPDQQVAEARQLIRLIASAKDTLPPKTLCWPLIVAGAGLAPAGDSDKAVVEERLDEVGRRSDVADGTLDGLSTLRAFWASGKTSWDDCFVDPIFSLSN